MMEFARQRFGRLWIAGALAALVFLMAYGGGSSPNHTDVAWPLAEREAGAAAAADEPAAAAGAPVTEAFRFEHPSASGGTVSLDSYIGDKNVVLVFYRAFW